MNEYDHLSRREATVMKLNRTGETGFDVLFENRSAEEIWNLLLESSPTAELSGQEALEILRVEAGIPVYGKDMDISTIPIEAGIWNALDFEKGCYVGQEVITSSTYSPTLGKNIAIGYIRREFRDFRGEITVGTEQRDDKTPNTVKITEKPFHSRFE